MSTVKSVLLAAGLGERLKPLTDQCPKCMVPVAGRPLLDYWLHRLTTAGVRDVLVNTHSHAERVRAYIRQTNQKGGMRLIESHEPQLLGSAGTISANADFATDCDHLILIYADNFSEADLGELLEFHRSHADPWTMLLFRADEPRQCGIAELDSNHRILSFTEKPSDPASNLANAGIYIVDQAAFREVAAMGATDIGFDVLPRFAGRMRGYEYTGYHKDIGTTQAYQQVCSEAPDILSRLGYLPDGRRAAVFFDRDGTIIENAHYLSDPNDVQLIPDAADTIRHLHQRGYACVVVSNQSGIGRGIITEQQHQQISERICELFAKQGAVFDALYHCPIMPSTKDRSKVEHEFRKPGPGMLRQAADELGLHLPSSWMVGDMISDVLAGHHAGCRQSILVTHGNPLINSTDQIVDQYGFAVESDLGATVRHIDSHDHKRFQ